jgi:hypothetical protein
LHHAFKVIITFQLVCVGWVFFRSSDVSQALSIFGQLARGWDILLHGERLVAAFSVVGLSRVDYAVIVVATMLLEWSASHTPQGLHFLAARSGVVRWSIYYAMGACVVLLGVFERGRFLYFQF